MRTRDVLSLRGAVKEIKERSNPSNHRGLQNRRNAQAEMLDSTKYIRVFLSVKLHNCLHPMRWFLFPVHASYLHIHQRWSWQQMLERLPHMKGEQ